MSFTLPTPGSSSRVLRHLKHMQPRGKVPMGKFANKMPSMHSHTPKYVQPKDRIAYWNIGPGDEVRVKTGGRKVVGERTGEKVRKPWEGVVATVDRERNVVWLKAGKEDEKEEKIPKNIKHIIPRLKDPEKGIEGGYSPNVAFTSRPIHYSNLQLKLPTDLNLPKDVLGELDLKEGVYASRIIQTKVKYDFQHGHFIWKRFAVVQGKSGILQVEVPWVTSTGRERTRKSNQTVFTSVDSESWIPWNPLDPIKLLPSRFARTSPQALQRYKDSLRQSENDKRIASMAVEPIVEQKLTIRRDGSYAGFAAKRGVKPPPTPQPPTPAELLSMARKNVREWFKDGALTKHIENGGRAFSALDYLSLTPTEGPTDAKWTSLPSLLPQHSGSGEPGESSTNAKRDVDNWPIELLMKDDLSNERGLRHRMRRWNVRQLAIKNQMAAREAAVKANAEALRRHVQT